MDGGLYAGWIIVDLRLLLFLALLSIGITLLLISLLIRGCIWHQYITIFIAISFFIFALGFVFLQLVLGYPIIIERDFFKL